MLLVCPRFALDTVRGIVGCEQDSVVVVGVSGPGAPSPAGGPGHRLSCPYSGSPMAGRRAAGRASLSRSCCRTSRRTCSADRAGRTRRYGPHARPVARRSGRRSRCQWSACGRRRRRGTPRRPHSHRRRRQRGRYRYRCRRRRPVRRPGCRRSIAAIDSSRRASRRGRCVRAIPRDHRVTAAGDQGREQKRDQAAQEDQPGCGSLLVAGHEFMLRGSCRVPPPPRPG